MGNSEKLSKTVVFFENSRVMTYKDVIPTQTQSIFYIFTFSSINHILLTLRPQVGCGLRGSNMEIGSKFYFSIHVNTKKKGQIAQIPPIFDEFADIPRV